MLKASSSATDQILYCVLNWGLGHASRSIPIIENLLGQGHSITLASDGEPLTLLRNAFPHLPHYQLPSYDIRYDYNSIAANLLGQCWKIIRAIKEEKKEIEQLVRKDGFTKIISDNRFGCYHSETRNIFITHQLRLIHNNRFMQAAATKMNLSMIQKFDECWIPDAENSNFSGEMNRNVSIDIPQNYIGIQSRFTKIPPPDQPSFLSLSILSGPEPQRTILQEILESQLASINGKHVIITGKLQDEYESQNLIFKGLLNVNEISELARKSKYIISRSGYSSIMDYEAMGRKAILIPTPGQTEQEYLGRLMGQSCRHTVLMQNQLDLSRIIR